MIPKLIHFPVDTFPEPKKNHTKTKDWDIFCYCSAKIYFPPYPIDVGLSYVIGFGQWNVSGHDVSRAPKHGCMVWLGSCAHIIHYNKNISWIVLVKKRASPS